MVRVLVKDRKRLEDAFVYMIRNADEWEQVWNIMSYGIGVDDFSTNVEEETVTLYFKQMTFEEFLQMFREEDHDIFEEVKIQEEPWSVCPYCKTKDFGENTVMNGVDANLQVQSLLDRFSAATHDHIVECRNCKTVYETGANVALLVREKKELEKLYKAYAQAE